MFQIPISDILWSNKFMLSKMFQMLTFHDIWIGRNPRLNLSIMNPNFKNFDKRASKVFSHDFNRNFKIVSVTCELLFPSFDLELISNHARIRL